MLLLRMSGASQHHKRLVELLATLLSQIEEIRIGLLNSVTWFQTLNSIMTMRSTLVPTHRKTSTVPAASRVSQYHRIRVLILYLWRLLVSLLQVDRAKNINIIRVGTLAREWYQVLQFYSMICVSSQIGITLVVLIALLQLMRLTTDNDDLLLIFPWEIYCSAHSW